MSQQTYRKNPRIMLMASETVAEEQTEHAATKGVFDMTRAWTRFTALIAVLAAVLVETLVGLRLAFLAGEANAANNFVEFIYDATRPLVAPFQDIFANRTLDNGGVFEPASAIAMGIFLFATIMVVWVLWAATPRTDGQYTASRRRYVVHH
jgi:hypothetical protein